MNSEIHDLLASLHARVCALERGTAERTRIGIKAVETGENVNLDTKPEVFKWVLQACDEAFHMKVRWMDDNNPNWSVELFVYKAGRRTAKIYIFYMVSSDTLTVQYPSTDDTETIDAVSRKSEAELKSEVTEAVGSLLPT